jgi:hypothetical protein
MPLFSSMASAHNAVDSTLRKTSATWAMPGMIALVESQPGAVEAFQTFPMEAT